MELVCALVTTVHAGSASRVFLVLSKLYGVCVCYYTFEVGSRGLDAPDHGSYFSLEAQGACVVRFQKQD